jgi:hypothetical protein
MVKLDIDHAKIKVGSVWVDMGLDQDHVRAMILASPIVRRENGRAFVYRDWGKVIVQRVWTIDYVGTQPIYIDAIANDGEDFYSLEDDWLERFGPV